MSYLHFRNCLRALVVAFCFLTVVTSTMKAQTGMPPPDGNPCEGRIVGKKAGSTPYAIPKDCDVVIMSLKMYDTMREEKYACLQRLEEIETAHRKDSQTLAGMNIEIAARDKKIAELTTAKILAEEEAASCKLVLGKANENLDAANANYDAAFEALGRQKKKTRLFTVLGTVGGAAAGLVTGLLVAGK